MGGGPKFPYLVVKRDFGTEPMTAEYALYKLPKEARGIEQLAFLTDKLLLGYISEGIFYLVDLGQQSQAKLQVALEIRLPAALIKRFAVDNRMNALSLCSSGGQVFLYNLP